MSEIENSLPPGSFKAEAVPVVEAEAGVVAPVKVKRTVSEILALAKGGKKVKIKKGVNDGS